MRRLVFFLSFSAAAAIAACGSSQDSSNEDSGGSSSTPPDALPEASSDQPPDGGTSNADAKLDARSDANLHVDANGVDAQTDGSVEGGVRQLGPLGKLTWLRSFPGVSSGNVVATATDELRASFEWFDPNGVDLGDGVLRGVGASQRQSALVHLSANGALSAVKQPAPLGVSLLTEIDHDCQRMHGLQRVGTSLFTWDYVNLQRMDDTSAVTPFFTQQVMLIKGASFYAGGAVAFVLNNSGSAKTWGSLSLGSGYSLVKFDAQGTPQWKKEISPSLTLSLYVPIRPLVDNLGRTYISDWILVNNQWTYDGAVRGTIAANQRGAFLLATDASGNVRWAKTLVSSHVEANVTKTRPFASALDQNGQLVVAAWADVDAGAGPYGTSNELAFIRFDDLGAPTLIAKLPAQELQHRNGLVFRADGSFFLTGTYSGTWTVGAKSYACNNAQAVCGFAAAFSSAGALTASAALQGCAAHGQFTRFGPPTLHGNGVAFAGWSGACSVDAQPLPDGAFVAHFEP